MSGDDWLLAVAAFFIGVNVGIAITRAIYER